MSYQKWTPQILDLSKEYILESSRPSISGLSRELGVSRQCMYDWALVYKDFFMVLNELRQGAISSLGSFDEYNHKGSVVRAKRLEGDAERRAERSKERKVANKQRKDKNLRSKKYRLEQKKIREESKAEDEAKRIAEMPKGEFEDGLGSDDDWDLDI